MGPDLSQRHSTSIKQTEIQLKAVHTRDRNIQVCEATRCRVPVVRYAVSKIATKALNAKAALCACAPFEQG